MEQLKLMEVNLRDRVTFAAAAALAAVLTALAATPVAAQDKSLRLNAGFSF